jgi:hypothetical protein
MLGLVIMDAATAEAVGPRFDVHLEWNSTSLRNET